MIGVARCHSTGQLATELANAAEMICRRPAAVHRGVRSAGTRMRNDARDDIAQAIARVHADAGVLILTDMFGGTPSNLGMTFLQSDKVEVITGVNLPMLIKLASMKGESNLLAVAREMRDEGRNAHLGRLRPAAWREDAMTSRSVTIVNQLGMHARGNGDFRLRNLDAPGSASSSVGKGTRWTGRASWGCSCSRRPGAGSSPLPPTAPMKNAPLRNSRTW